MSNPAPPKEPAPQARSELGQPKERSKPAGVPGGKQPAQMTGGAASGAQPGLPQGTPTKQGQSP
eukprot:7944017-Lingulodinium_polyedra.AAC.1